MNSSGITGTDNFVMQDATQLIKNSGLEEVTRVAGAITDVAALGERAVFGYGRVHPQCTCGKGTQKPRKRKNNKKIN